MKTSRREFVIKSAMAAVGIAYGNKSKSDFALSNLEALNSQAAENPIQISIFSKSMHELGYKEIPPIVAEMGFDGIDLTVRPNGHVLPENVERDLPLAAESAARSGLKLHMITTDIIDAKDKYTERILKTASRVGVKHYRMGRIFYNPQKSIAQNLEHFRIEFEKLNELNEKYEIRGECQNHAGNGFGAPVWDLAEVLKKMTASWTGVQYDILHATVEGANSWTLGFDLLKPYIGTIDIKDFYWKKANGKWELEVVPLGEGMVDYKKFIALLRSNNIHVPFSIHCEYFAENENLQVKIPKMQQDLTTFRKWLKESGM